MSGPSSCRDLLRAALWALAVVACDDGVETAEVRDPDAGDAAVAADVGAPAWPCREGWRTSADGISCEPDATPCADGACEWPCVEGWARGEAGCAPPPLPDCPGGRFAYPGGCSAEWPCPADWSRIQGIGCAPARDRCALGTRPDWDGRCDRLGFDACEEAAAPPGAIHVDGEAGEDGDGTARRPLRTLADGLARAEPGDVVVLAPGRYSAPAVVGVELRGRCADEVWVATPMLGDGAALRGLALDASEVAPALAPGAAVELSEVRVAGASAGLSVPAGARLVGRGLALSGAGPGVLVAAGATLLCERCLVENAHRSAFEIHGEATLRRTTVRGPGFRAIRAMPGGSLTMEDLRVVGAARALMFEGARGTARRVAIEGGTSGVRAIGAADVSFVDLATMGNGGQDFFLNAGRAEVRRFTVDARGVAVRARSGAVVVREGGELELTQGFFDPGSGMGISMHRGLVRARDVAIVGGLLGLDVGAESRFEGVGLWVTGSNTASAFVSSGDLVLSASRLGPGQEPQAVSPFVSILADEDLDGRPATVVLDDVELNLGPHVAVGVGVLDDTEVTARRLSVVARGEGTDRTGIAVFAGQVSVEGGFFDVPRIATGVSDAAAIELRDIAADTSAVVHDAIDVYEGARVTLERFELLAAGGPIGVAQGGGSRLEARFVRALGASNLAALDGARLVVEDAWLERPVAAGVVVAGGDAHAVVRRVRMIDGVPAFGAGRFVGLFAGTGAAATVDDLVVTGAVGVGVFARLASVTFAGVAVASGRRLGLEAADGVRVEQSTVKGADLRVEGIEGPGLVVLDSSLEVARAAILGNEVGVLRRGENSIRLEPALVVDNRMEDDVCDQCSAAPPSVPPPRPLPPF